MTAFNAMLEPWLQINDALWLEWVKYTVKVFYSVKMA